MRAPFITSLVLLLPFVSSAQPGRDARARTGTAAISGTVVSDESEPRPIRRARVIARATELGPNGRTVATDDRGGFVLTGLPAARVALTVEKEGWVATSYGAKRPGRPGTSIAVNEGQQVTGIAIRVPRGGVITGSVFDQNGYPAIGTMVRAMRYRFMGGVRRLIGAGTGGSVDDRGIYRIHSLPAGDYVVAASAPRGGPFSTADLAITTPGDVSRARRDLAAPSGSQIAPGMPAAANQGGAPRATSVTYAPVYYPGSPVPTQATLVPVAAGEERGGIDIQLQLAPTSRIEGTIAVPEGTSASTVAVSLVLLGEELTAMSMFFDSAYRTTRAGADGRFTFAGVRPGRYILSARAQAPGAAPSSASLVQLGTLWGATELTIDGNDISNVLLELQPGMTVSGRIQFETSDPASAPDPSKFRVNLSAAAGQVTFGSSPGSVDAGGAFTITGVTPGRYTVSSGVPGAVPNASRWALKSAVVDGRDTLDTPIDIRPGQHVGGVVLTFTDRPAELAGAVTDAAGQPAADYFVIVFAADRTFWTPQSRRIKGVRPAHDGKYTIRNLPAGEYLIAAAIDVEQDEWFDPVFLQKLAPSALRIAINDGETKAQDLQIGPGR